MQRKNLLLIGCGHSHLEILRKFSCAKDSIDFKITLVDPKNQTTYSGMLPGIVAGHYNPKEAQMNLAQIANKCDVEFKKNKIIRLDINNNKAYCENNEAIQFDVAAINIGSKTVTPDIFEPSPNVCSVQAIDSLLRNMQDILSAGKKDHRLKISVIGGGAAGIEIVLAINYFLNKNQIKHDARLITASENILPGYPIRMKRIFSKILTREKIKIVTNDRVSIIKGTNITTESKNHFTSDYVFIATGGRAPRWPKESGLKVDDNGYIAVTESLLSRNAKNIFASGDICSVENHFRPKSGVYAVNHGILLEKNIRRLFSGKKLLSEIPKTYPLSIITAGKRWAMANKGFFQVHGELIWHLKKMIDKNYISKIKMLEKAS